MEHTTDDAKFDLDAAIRLLRQQVELYTRLRDLAAQQRQLVSADRPELLLSILTERQALVTRLLGIHKQLGPLRREWDRLYPALPEAQRAQMRDLIAQAGRSAEAICKSDQEDSSTLAARKEAVAGVLRGVDGGRAANQAYRREATGGGDTADMMG